MKYEIIRRLRREMGLTLEELGAQTGYTPSFLSQIERGLKEPSLDAMRKIANALGVSVIALLGEDADGRQTRRAGASVVRRLERRPFTVEGKQTVYELLTPQAEEEPRRCAMYGILATTEAHRWTNEKPVSHFYEECCYILSGTMRAVVGSEAYDLEEGDSLYIDGFVPHNFYNSGETPLVVLAFQSKG